MNKNIFKLSTKFTIHKPLQKIDQVNYMKNILSLWIQRKNKDHRLRKNTSDIYKMINVKRILGVSLKEKKDKNKIKSVK